MLAEDTTNLVEEVQEVQEVRVGQGKETVLLNPELLVIIPGWNEKEYSEEDIEEMAASLETVGQREDIRVISYKKDKVFQTKQGEFTLKAGQIAVTHGHRRTRGARLLRERGVKINLSAKFENENTSEADLILTQAIDNSGIKPTPLQEGLLFKRSLILGNTEEQIAKFRGKSIQFVKDRLALAELPALVQNLIKEDKISATNASRIFDASNNEADSLKLVNLVAEKEGEVIYAAETVIESLKQTGGDTKAAMQKLEEAAEITKAANRVRVGRQDLATLVAAPALPTACKCMDTSTHCWISCTHTES